MSIDDKVHLVTAALSTNDVYFLPMLLPLVESLLFHNNHPVNQADCGGTAVTQHLSFDSVVQRDIKPSRPVGDADAFLVELFKHFFVGNFSSISSPQQGSRR